CSLPSTTLRTERTCSIFVSPTSRPVRRIVRLRSCLSLKNIRLPGSLTSTYVCPSSQARPNQYGAASLSSFTPALSSKSPSGTTLPANSLVFCSGSPEMTNPAITQGNSAISNANTSEQRRGFMFGAPNSGNIIHDTAFSWPRRISASKRQPLNIELHLPELGGSGRQACAKRKSARGVRASNALAG